MKDTERPKNFYSTR